MAGKVGRRLSDLGAAAILLAQGVQAWAKSPTWAAAKVGDVLISEWPLALTAFLGTSYLVARTVGWRPGTRGEQPKKSSFHIISTTLSHTIEPDGGTWLEKVVLFRVTSDDLSLIPDRGHVADSGIDVRTADYRIDGVPSDRPKCNHNEIEDPIAYGSVEWALAFNKPLERGRTYVRRLKYKMQCPFPLGRTSMNFTVGQTPTDQVVVSFQFPRDYEVADAALVQLTDSGEAPVPGAIQRTIGRTGGEHLTASIAQPQPGERYMVKWAVPETSRVGRDWRIVRPASSDQRNGSPGAGGGPAGKPVT